jgi:hypothetical protein
MESEISFHRKGKNSPLVPLLRFFIRSQAEKGRRTDLVGK